MALLMSIDETIGQLSQVIHYLDKKGGLKMDHTILIKSLPEITVAYRRLIIPYHEALFD